MLKKSKRRSDVKEEQESCQERERGECRWGARGGAMSRRSKRKNNVEEEYKQCQQKIGGGAPLKSNSDVEEEKE